MDAEAAKKFLERVVEQEWNRGLTSDEHFTVDGPLLDAWASVKSFQRKDRKGKTPPDAFWNPKVEFHGEQRSNDSHPF